METQTAKITDIDMSIKQMIVLTFKFWVAQVIIGVFFGSIGAAIMLIITLIGAALVSA
tara:strand:+ start:712 stop:885 length:174 start_codon:yes stop_codon:yes gene_type:complete